MTFRTSREIGGSAIWLVLWEIVGLCSSATLQAEVPPAASVESTRPAPVTAAAVRQHIDYLASPRMAGRGGPQRLLAAKYIRDHFGEAGLLPLFPEGEFYQPVPGARAIGDDQDAEAPIIGVNVGGWIPGSDPELCDEYVIISAHYDHLGIRNGELHPGADDNASGVSMLLETARAVSRMPVKPRRSVVFVAFDLEEELLWGSRWFAAHPPWPLERLKLFMTADMIGRSLGNLPLPTVFVLGSEHAPLLQSTLDQVSVPEGLEIARLGIDLIGTRSDYGPFRERQIPFLFFSTGQHADYHTPRDTPDLIDAEKVARVSNVVLAVALEISDSEEVPVWTDAPPPSLEEASAIHRITELVLEADRTGARSMSGVQRFFVSQVHAKTGNAIKLGRITEPERRWLSRSSKLLLLSVF
ncbi:MAG: M28 family peptidase [Planctomycetaceae bacterium]|nr:M28 family peptidase [Planctomycetaceae bacterium]